jgi:xylulokinase
MDACFLGIDLGTSGLRALLVTKSGEIIGEGDAHYSVSNPADGFSEQDPADWVSACQVALGALRQAFPEAYRSVAGIGVAGHMHGATLLDAAGAVLRPCILWNDTRSHAEAAALDAAENLRALSGNIVFPGFTAPKLMWVARHEPEIFAKIKRVLLPAAYLSFWLTGEAVADLSDSAGTAWLDVGARDWSPALLAASGMTLGQMPRLVEGCACAAKLDPARAAELHLSPEAQVVGGAGDNAAAACGVGALDEGDGFVSLGTSGVLLAARDGYAPLPASAVHTFCHAVPDRWYQMGVILSATDSLNWLSNITGCSPAKMTQALGKTLTGPSDVKFYPYLSGERTPHNDAQIRGGFAGIGQRSSQQDMTQAVLEGVSFALRDCLEALRKTGANPKSLLAIGGGTASDFWLQTLATVLNLPLDLPKSGEFGAALGAARLAIVGITKLPPEQVMTKPEIARRILPNAALQTEYEKAYRHFATRFEYVKELQ